MPPQWSFYCSGTLDQNVILGIFVASLRAVGCAATLAAAGLWLARNGHMSPSLSKGLSQLSVKLAIPALLFSSVVPGVSSELLGYAWPLLLLPAVYLLLGLLIGALMLQLVQPPSNFRLSTVAACTFGNTTGIPVVLLSVLQQSLSRSVFADIADPLLFLSIELVTLPLLQWLVGLALLRYWPSSGSDSGSGFGGGGPWCGVCACCPFGSCCDPCCGVCGGGATDEDAHELVGATDEESISRSGEYTGSGEYPSVEGAPAARPVDGRFATTSARSSSPRGGSARTPSDELLLDAQPAGRRPIRRHHPGEESTGFISMMSLGEDQVVPVEEQSVLSLHQMELRTTQRRPLREMLDGARKAVSVVCRVVGKLLRRTFVPQVVGIVAGFAVGLFGRQLVLPPETAPLGWLFIGVSKLGAAAVPINLILLGAALSRTPERGQLPPLTVAGITVGRMIFMPLCGLGVARLLSATHFAVIPYIVADPFWLVCLILTATPTANNIVVLCDLAGENRRAMSAAIFYQYCFAPLLLPGVLTLFIGFICRTRREAADT